MTRPRVYDPEVPLFLIASTIAEGVRRRGGKLFRISVVRTHTHQYRIKYKCRAKDAHSTRAGRIMSPGPEEMPVNRMEAGRHE